MPAVYISIGFFVALVVTGLLYVTFPIWGLFFFDMDMEWDPFWKWGSED